MVFLSILLTVFTFCVADKDFWFTQDNSQYIEGVSRYFWLSDDLGSPYLVDLQEPLDEDILDFRFGGNNQYYLYTRKNRKKPQEIIYGNADSISSSNYDTNKPLMVIVHGWKSNANTETNMLVIETYLSVENANVIVVDWQTIANANYLTASYGTISVGQFLGSFLIWLVNATGGDWNKTHLVGFSLGAHVVGVAGRTAGGWPRRVTGLDPAGPLWVKNNNALNHTAGQYVEVIHTDSGILGTSSPTGHADFYPNGGSNPQPGCWFNTCSHRRAVELFASSLYYNTFVGRWCQNLTDAYNMDCSGNALLMGNSNLSKQGCGIYTLETGDTWPY